MNTSPGALLLCVLFSTFLDRSESSGYGTSGYQKPGRQFTPSPNQPGNSNPNVKAGNSNSYANSNPAQQKPGYPNANAKTKAVEHIDAGDPDLTDYVEEESEESARGLTIGKGPNTPPPFRKDIPTNSCPPKPNAPCGNNLNRALKCSSDQDCPAPKKCCDMPCGFVCRVPMGAGQGR